MSERVELDKRDTGSRRPLEGNAAPKSSPSISPQLAASNEQRLVRLLLEKLDDQRTQIESVLHDRLTMNDGAPGDQ
jgi:hypothetical protein